jgi:protein Mpv17
MWTGDMLEQYVQHRLSIKEFDSRRITFVQSHPSLSSDLPISNSTTSIDQVASSSLSSANVHETTPGGNQVVLVSPPSRPDFLRDYDVARSSRMALIGVSMGTLFHYWFQFLSKVVPGTSPRSVLLKVGIDQTFMAPTFLVYFFSTLGMLQGKSKDQIITFITDNYTESLKTNYMIWPLAQIINFYFIPQNLQVFYSNCIGLGFNFCLAYISNRKGKVEIDIE